MTRVEYPTVSEWKTLRKFGLTESGANVVLVSPEGKNSFEESGASWVDIQEAAQDWDFAEPDVRVEVVANEHHLFADYVQSHSENDNE